MIVKVQDYLKKLSFSSSTTVYVACSGGPDSTVLGHILKRLSAQYSFSVVLLYLDHGQRGEVERKLERQHIESFAQSLAVPLYTCILPPKYLEKRAVEKRISFEALARKIRYSFLESFGGPNDFIALGHNEDDQYETMVMRFFQGASLEGLKGIPEKRGRLIRPISSCSRQDILAYAEMHGLRFIIDTTNEQNDYLRNQIRNRLFPIIKEIFPGYPRALSSLGRKLTIALDGLNQNIPVERAYLGFGVGRRPVEISMVLEDYKALSHHNRLKFLYEAHNDLSWGDSNHILEDERIPFRHLENLLIQSPSMFSENSRLLSGFGIEVIASAGRIVCRKLFDNKMKKGYFYPVPECGTRHYDDIEIHVGTGIKAERGEEQVFIPAWMSNQSFFIRQRLEGDYIQLESGKVSLKRLFQDRGIKPVERESVPLLVGKEGILAVFLSLVGLTILVNSVLYRTDENSNGILISLNRSNLPK